MKPYPFCFAKPAVKATGFVRAGGDVKPVMGDTVGQILGADLGGGARVFKEGFGKPSGAGWSPYPFPRGRLQ